MAEVQVHRQRRGVKLPPGVKSVARPSRWGNPWPVGGFLPVPGTDYLIEVDALLAVVLYRRWLADRLEADPGFLDPLEGYDLACYCRAGEPCHAQVLAARLER